MISGVYKYTNCITGRVYIGSSIDLDERHLAHKNRTSGARKFLDAINKYGFECFSYEILVITKNYFNLSLKDYREYIFSVEQIYLDLYFAQEYIKSNKKDRRFRDLTYNINPVARGGLCTEWSNESKIKLKQKFKLFGHTCEGRTYSKETKQKMSNTHKERSVSVGNKNPNFGKKSTEEKKQKVLESWKKSGKLYEFFAIDKELNVFGPLINVKEYARNNNLEAKGLYLCFKGEIRSYKNIAYCYSENLELKLEEIKNEPNYFTRKHLKNGKSTDNKSTKG